uniref:Uncharacterized protein n=1 Tax=Zea mays TaxID=4577 RepID=B6SNY5_MAIZE|nr:hypothetical protein [Zea mays]
MRDGAGARPPTRRCARMGRRPRRASPLSRPRRPLRCGPTILRARGHGMSVLPRLGGRAPARARPHPGTGAIAMPACALAVVAVHLDAGKQKPAGLKRRSGRNIH